MLNITWDKINEQLKISISIYLKLKEFQVAKSNSWENLLF